MIAEIDEATEYFQSEISRRIFSTAQLIVKMQKNPSDAQMNKLKKNLRVAHIKQRSNENQL